MLIHLRSEINRLGFEGQKVNCLDLHVGGSIRSRSVKPRLTCYECVSYKAGSVAAAAVVVALVKVFMTEEQGWGGGIAASFLPSCSMSENFLFGRKLLPKNSKFEAGNPPF